jgi:hypothetical protein
MKMTPRQILMVSMVALFFIALVLELIRRHMMREKYSLLWFFIALAALSVPLLYTLYARIANFMGIIEVTNFFFFLAIIALFLMSLQFSLALSSAYARSKVLIQQIGLLENRVRELEQKLSRPGPAGASDPSGSAEDSS